MSTGGPRGPYRDGLVTEATKMVERGIGSRFEAARKPFLLLQVEGPGAPREVKLDLPEMVVGRSLQAHLAIESSLISRQHFALRRQGPDYVCVDLDSVNGLYLNGLRVHSAVLRDGDVLQIGDVVLLYREGDA
ncbi:MAG TPA: FHA domain-containing protein [Polyangiaceae bacterium]|nr:FHA domain-containing protein [Polyangiaceae bacterium]